MRSRTQRFLFAALIAIPSTARADTIYLLDGTSIGDCTIQEEGLARVTYRKDKREAEVASDKVLEVEYDRKPSLVDRAQTSLADGLYEDALVDLEDFVKEALEKPSKRYPWATAYAIYLELEIHEALGEPEKAAAAADRLLEHAPDSRYVPLALLRKAQAMASAGKGEAAQKALDRLGALIDEKQLPERWKLARDLGQVLADPKLEGSALRTRLDDVAARSAQHPVVRNRARVAIGESFLGEKKLKDAETIFREIVADPTADDRTLAAAYTGLGDCLFQRGFQQSNEGKDANAALHDALLNYMRVAVVYEHESRYVPKALFYAARSYQLMKGDEAEERAGRLFRKLAREYPGSEWASQATGFRQ